LPPTIRLFLDIYAVQKKSISLTLHFPICSILLQIDLSFIVSLLFVLYPLFTVFMSMAQ